MLIGWLLQKYGWNTWNMDFCLLEYARSNFPVTFLERHLES